MLSLLGARPNLRRGGGNGLSAGFMKDSYVKWKKKMKELKSLALLITIIHQNQVAEENLTMT